MSEILLKVVALICMAIITYIIVPFLKEKKLYAYVDIAVRAAEQIFKESGSGPQKFAYVTEWIKNKFKVTDEDLKRIIEWAVYNMNLEKGAEDNGKKV